MVFYPLTALINLFIYILQRPLYPGVNSDIALMYQVAGHFSYLEFAIGDLSYPFVTQVGNLARLTVSRARERRLNRPDDEAPLDVLNIDGIGDDLDLSTLDDVSCAAPHLLLTKVY